MEFFDIALLAGFVLAYALVSRRLETTPITGPMVFVGFGLIIGSGGFSFVDIGMDEGAVRTLAEATLVLLLFTDAIRIDLDRLRRQLQLPARLLGVGLPLTVVAGTVVALVIFPDFGVWEAALLAAILAPTDAALGRAVVANPRVPVRVRQALNVESGLNDGLMLPIITLILALAAAGIDLETPGYWAEFAVEQIGYGILAGAVSGYAGGRLIRAFSDARLDGRRLPATGHIGRRSRGVRSRRSDRRQRVRGRLCGRPCLRGGSHDYCAGVYDFAEDQAELLALLTFLFFGAALAGPALDDFSWRIGLYALLSLSVVRMIPVAISLAGTRLKSPTIAYLGWFGPRGLASILFGLFILEEAALPVADEVFDVVIWTVLASIFLHGATSLWLSERYGSWFAAHGRKHMQEAMPVEEMPIR